MEGIEKDKPTEGSAVAVFSRLHTARSIHPTEHNNQLDGFLPQETDLSERESRNKGPEGIEWNLMNI